VKDVPVLYIPYMFFPIDNRRASGFLFPTISYSKINGFDLTIPLYLNLAPNYDATITPRWMTHRGVLLDGWFRYMSTHSHGDVELGFIPDDREFPDFKQEQAREHPKSPLIQRLFDASNNRYFVHAADETQLNRYWSYGWNYNRVSDDYYFQDFSRDVMSLSNTQLPQNVHVNFNSPHWNFLARVQNYQTLHQINRQAVSDPYNRLPQLVLNAHYPNLFSGFDTQWHNEFVYFEKSKDPNTHRSLPAGYRYQTQPRVSLPFRTAGGFLIPSAQLLATHYDIQNQRVGFARHKSRTLGLFDIDSGLTFDRLITLFNHHLRQTLEPRLYYLYVPFRDQSDYPLFDTGYQIFNFDQLFRVNRFSGLDRIGDANQLSLAVHTSLFDADTGQRIFQAGIGDIAYFSKRRVTLCTTPGCQDTSALGFTSNTTTFSPIVAAMHYWFYPNWSVSGTLAWDPEIADTNNAHVNLHYQSDAQHIIDASYTFLKNGDTIANDPSNSRGDLHQFGFSFAFPLTQHWSSLGTWSYNLAAKHTQTYFVGAEYDSCCWAIRAIGGRTTTALDQNNNPTYDTVVYIQFLLKGLGMIANNDPSTILTTRIPGYQDVFTNKRY